jgi:hypothetical protein
MKFKIGDAIIGKTKNFKNKEGFVSDIVKIRHQINFIVAWTDGIESSVKGKDIALKDISLLDNENHPDLDLMPPLLDDTTVQFNGDDGDGDDDDETVQWAFVDEYSLNIDYIFFNNILI